VTAAGLKDEGLECRLPRRLVLRWLDRVLLTFRCQRPLALCQTAVEAGALVPARRSRRFAFRSARQLLHPESGVRRGIQKIPKRDG